MGKIERLIREEAAKDNHTTHNAVCKDVVRFAENNNIPMALLLYIAVGTMAHKEEAFNKGYKNFQHEKAASVITLSDLFAKYFNIPSARTNDKVVHCCSRYYTYQGGNITKFQNLLKEKNKDEFALKNFKTAKELAAYLFGDKTEYTQKGYIAKTIERKKF